MHERPRVTDEERRLQPAIQQERNELTSGSSDDYGTGLFPEAILDGKLHAGNYVDYLVRHTRESQPIRILELGAGKDCALWTGGHEKNPNRHPSFSSAREPLNAVSTAWKQQGIDVTVTAHSGTDTHASWIQSHGVNRFISGHFLDAVNTLLSEKKQFDLIISRRGLYHTSTSILLMKKINGLLSPDGSAFIDGINRWVDMRVLIYNSHSLPNSPLCSADIGKAQPFREAFRTRLPNISWSNDAEYVGAAWKKGNWDESRFPKLAYLSPVPNDIHGAARMCAVYALV